MGHFSQVLELIMLVERKKRKECTPRMTKAGRGNILRPKKEEKKPSITTSCHQRSKQPSPSPTSYSLLLPAFALKGYHLEWKILNSSHSKCFTQRYLPYFLSLRSAPHSYGKSERPRIHQVICFRTLHYILLASQNQVTNPQQFSLYLSYKSLFSTWKCR